MNHDWLLVLLGYIMGVIVTKLQHTINEKRKKEKEKGEE